jgi:hypothetical protein
MRLLFKYIIIYPYGIEFFKHITKFSFEKIFSRVSSVLKGDSNNSYRRGLANHYDLTFFTGLFDTFQIQYKKPLQKVGSEEVQIKVGKLSKIDFSLLRAVHSVYYKDPRAEAEFRNIRGVLGNKCAGQHNLKTLHFKETIVSASF